LETVNVRVVPVPDKVPLVADPVPDVIVKSLTSNPVGTALKVKLIAVAIGLPVGVAVHVIGPERKIDCEKLAIPPLLIEISTFPILTLETVNVRVVPEPDKVPLVAEPLPDVIVKSVATKPVGSALKVKLIAVVIGLPVAVAVQVIGPERLIV
jgi:hypothetical protein